VPLVPVTLIVNVPFVVVRVVRTVSVDDPGAATGLVENVAVAPDGSPVTARETLPENPPVVPMDTVYVALPPAVAVTDAGLRAIEKFGGTATTSVTDAVCEREPLTPLIVSG
jgi:hypothetical protein